MPLPQIDKRGRSPTKPPRSTRPEKGRSGCSGSGGGGVVALPDINASSRQRAATPNYRRVRKFLVKKDNLLLDNVPAVLVLPPTPPPMIKDVARPEEDTLPCSDDSFQQELAAQQIQRLQRGSSARKEIGVKHVAATKVQTLHRGSQVRTDLKDTRQALVEDHFGGVGETYVPHDAVKRGSSILPPGEEAWPETECVDEVRTSERRASDVSLVRNSLDPAVVSEANNQADLVKKSSITEESELAVEEEMAVGEKTPDTSEESLKAEKETGVQLADDNSLSSSVEVFKDEVLFSDRYLVAGDADSSPKSVLIYEEAISPESLHTAAADASVQSSGSIQIDKEAVTFESRYTAAAATDDAVGDDDDASAITFVGGGDNDGAIDDGEALHGTDAEQQQHEPLAHKQGGVMVGANHEIVVVAGAGSAAGGGAAAADGPWSVNEPSDMGSLDEGASLFTVDDASLDFAERYRVGPCRKQSISEAFEEPIEPLPQPTMAAAAAATAPPAIAEEPPAAVAPAACVESPDSANVETGAAAVSSGPEEAPVVGPAPEAAAAAAAAETTAEATAEVSASPVPPVISAAAESPVSENVEIGAAVVSSEPEVAPVVEPSPEAAAAETTAETTAEVSASPEPPVISAAAESPVSSEPEVAPVVEPAPEAAAAAAAAGDTAAAAAAAAEVPASPEPPATAAVLPDDEAEEPGVAAEPEAPWYAAESGAVEDMLALMSHVSPPATANNPGSRGLATADTTTSAMTTSAMTTPLAKTQSRSSSLSKSHSGSPSRQQAMADALESKDETALVLASELRAVTAEADVLRGITTDQKATIDALIGAKTMQDTLTRSENEASALKLTALAQAQTIELLMAEIRNLKTREGSAAV
eukprot:CAMPEP_0171986548 /NCGR_PEP_ID=MMETSP0993-20121228/274923_1 /TAXON_ID=483369 /ORGANISM="non described non described, Strain CCMP2098" /LENGTH=873 /DNA_ID=CAMNT_0012639457 /DNA_START=234 /DNA_END=2855 /DNA_ORIENTATION=+